MNKLIEWVKENVILAVIVSVGLLFISAAVGFTIGIVKRRSAGKESFEIGVSRDFFQENTMPVKKQQSLLLPKPLILTAGGEYYEYSFYLDRDESNINELSIIPVKLSELLKYRDIGLKSDIKVFQFQNEELDVVIKKDELAQP